MKAIVFAAGLGTRLKPFTLSHPKALVDVGGKPMLQRVIERLADAGIKEIVVNVHHFASQIVDFIDANHAFGLDIRISDESDLLLDTGGGIARAAELLRDGEPFIACNADILTDFPLAEMIDAHRRSGADVTLLADQRVSSRRLYFTPDTHRSEPLDGQNGAPSRLVGWQNISTGETRPASFTPSLLADSISLAFGGYHIINQSVLPLLQSTAASTPVFSIIPFYLAHLPNLDIRAYTPSAPYFWHDVGRPDSLAAARASLLPNL